MKENMEIAEQTSSGRPSAGSLWEIYTTTFSKYFTFKGRSSRYEYWGFNFLNALIMMLLGIAIAFNPLAIFPYGLYCLVIIIPSLSVLSRRLHDVNKSGWTILLPAGVAAVTCLVVAILIAAKITVMNDSINDRIWLVSMVWSISIIAAILYLWYLTCKSGKPEENKYGEPVIETKKQKIQGIIFIVAVIVISIISNVMSFVLGVGQYGIGNDINQIADNIKTYYQNEDNFDGLNNRTAIENGILPSHMVQVTENGQEIHLEGVSTLIIEGESNMFAIAAEGITSSACEDIKGLKNLDYSIDMIITNGTDGGCDCPDGKCLVSIYYKK